MTEQQHRAQEEELPPPCKLILPVPLEQAKLMPIHIVVSSEFIKPSMDQKTIAAVCRLLINTMFYCLASSPPIVPGVYVPTASPLLSADVRGDDDDDDSRRKANVTAATATGGSSKEDEQDPKEAIVRAMCLALENEFMPFLMDAVDPLLRRGDGDDDNTKNDDDGGNTSSSSSSQLNTNFFVSSSSHDEGCDAKKQQRNKVRVGAVFNKTGHMTTMGSLESCGLGVAGVFVKPISEAS